MSKKESEKSQEKESVQVKKRPKLVNVSLDRCKAIDNIIKNNPMYRSRDHFVDVAIFELIQKEKEGKDVKAK